MSARSWVNVIIILVFLQKRDYTIPLFQRLLHRVHYQIIVRFTLTRVNEFGLFLKQ